MSSPAPKFLKVEGHDGLYRDASTGAIVNRDPNGFQAYMESVRLAREKEQQIQSHADEINTLKNEMTEIKSLLLQLINKDK